VCEQEVSRGQESVKLGHASSRVGDEPPMVATSLSPAFRAAAGSWA